MNTPVDAVSAIVVVGGTEGITLIPADSPLTRLNYFDGKFLRAADLTAEQDYLLRLDAAGNRAGGAGVVHGFDVTLGSGDTLSLGAGLAIAPDGKVLQLPRTVDVGIAALIAASNPGGAAPAVGAGGGDGFGACALDTTQPPAAALPTQSLYLLLLEHAEALCGEEDVYGSLCEAACATTTARPYRIEGVRLRALPLRLTTPLPDTDAAAITDLHLRSRVAASYFADERALVGDLRSAAGLAAATWCLGAPAAGGSGVALGVLARAGTTTLFLDAWTARRERIEAPPYRYWQGRLGQRPLAVFLAQVFQFQCQLRDALANPAPGGDGDPCAGPRALLAEADAAMAAVERYYAEVATHLASLPVLDTRVSLRPPPLAAVQALRRRFEGVSAGAATPTAQLDPGTLFARGIVNLPSAGFLPVVPGAGMPLEDQVRAQTGDGVELAFCAARPDEIAQIFDEARHLDRISLLSGLDTPAAKPKVDIWVPDGQFVATAPVATGPYFAASISELRNNQEVARLSGAARLESLASGGVAVHFAGADDPGADLPSLGGNASLGDVAGGRLGAAVAASAERAAPATAATTDSGGGTRPVRVVTDADIAGVAGRATVTRETAASRLTALAAAAAASREAAAAPAPAAAAAPAAGSTGSGAGTAGTTANTTAANASFSSARAAATVAVRALLDGAVAWVSLRVERDPFTLDGGGSCPFGLRFVRTRLGNVVTLEDLDLRGELLVRAGKTSATRTLVGTLTGLYSTTRDPDAAPGGNEPENQVDQGTLSLAARVILTRTAGGARVELRLLMPGESSAQIVLDAAWAGAALTIDAGAGVITRNADTGAETRQDAFRAHLVETAGIGEASHPLHVRAVAALAELGRHLDEPELADAWLRQLFPTPPAPPSVLRATRDWVMFTRRRERQCAAVAVQPVPDRRYRVLLLRDASEARVASLRRALAQGDAATLARLGLVAAGEVAFAAGLPAIVSDPAALAASLQVAQAEAQLTYIALAIVDPDAEAEAQSLGEARIARIEKAVASVTTPAEERAAEVFAPLPEGLDADGADGVIVIATDAVVSVCLTVLRAANLDAWSAAMRFAASGNFATVTGQGLASIVASATFAADDTFTGNVDALRAAWASGGGGLIERAGLVLAGSAEAQIPSRRTQAQTVMGLIGADSSLDVQLAPQAPPGGCGVWLIAAPVGVTVRGALVLQGSFDNDMFFLPQNGPNTSVEFRDNVLSGDTLRSFFAALSPNVAVSRIRLATIGAVDGGAQTRLQGVVNALTAAGRPAPDATRLSVRALDTAQQAELQRVGRSAAGFGDVIFFSPN